MKRTFLTIDDVLRHNWQFPETTSHQTDRLLRSTRLEDAIYTDLRQEDATMDAVEAAATTQLPSFPALSRDVFQSFYALAPKRNNEAVLSCAARKFHAHLLDHVMQQDDFPTLKNICEGRELPAYDAAAEFLSRTADQLDSLLADLGGDKGALHTLEKLEQAQQEAAETFSALMEQYRASAAGRELRKVVETRREELRIIRDTCGEDAEACTTEYLRNLSLNAALNEYQRRKDSRAAQAQAEAARKVVEQARRAAPVIVPPTEEERAIRAEAAQVAQASAFVTPEGRLDMSLLQTFAQPQEEPQRRRYRFWVEFTQEDIDWFKQSAAERGFRFGSIK